MAFWKDLGDKVTQTTAKTLQKAKDVTQQGKLHLQIGEEERKIERCYTELGKLYIAKHGSSPEPDFASLVDEITRAEHTIITYKQEIQDLKHRNTCSKCGTEVPEESKFCPTCGTKMERQTAPQEGMRCSHCWAPLEPGAKFCTVCGTPVPTSVVNHPAASTTTQTTGSSTQTENASGTLAGETMQAAVAVPVDTAPHDEIVGAVKETADPVPVNPAEEQSAPSLEVTEEATETGETIAVSHEETVAAAVAADSPPPAADGPAQDNPAEPAVSDEQANIGPEQKDEEKSAHEAAAAEPGASETVPTTRTCQQCGNTLRPESKFCMKCGAKMND